MNPQKNFISAFLLFLISSLGDAQIPAYYNDVNLNLTGLALKTELATKITNTHTTNLSYTPGVWDALKQTDLDPTNSANVLLIYGYNDSDGNYITDRSRDKTLNGGTAGTEWNREHTYAKSLGTPNLGTSGPGSDAHHLRSADITMNGNRGSLKFITGSGNAGVNGSGWYPGDEWKGDVARMMMYMYLRYGSRCLPSNVAIGTTNTVDPDMIDLFLQWNANDPVSNYEKQRNPVLESLQGNRNPFIDNPAFATQIWGGPQAEDLFTTAGANCSDLFISEYIEGSGNNKYIEIYNPTASSIDLGTGSYDIVSYTNGSATVSNTLTLTGTIAAYSTFVIENSSEGLGITADLSTTNAVMSFNGDDAVALRKSTTIIDVIGQIGFDPGSEWVGTTCTTGTANGGMRRNATVNTGDSDGSNVFDPDVEWTCVGIDIVSDLGSYTNNCSVSGPEIDVQGNSVSIPDGSTAISLTNDTDFGSVDTASGTIVKTFTILNTGGSDLTLTGNPVISGTNAADFGLTTNPTSPITNGGSTTFQITFNPSADGLRSATVTITNNDADEGTYTFNIGGTGATVVDCTTSSVSIFNEDFEAASSITNTGTVTISTGNGLFPADPKYVSGTQGLQVSNSTVSLTSVTFDTSQYTNISLTMRLAAFSGTTTNGMDPADYVKVFISTDNGATYSEELTVVGPTANNARWSFISGTGVATTVYDGNNVTTTFQPAGGGDRTTDGYSTLTITGLPSSATLKFRIDVITNSTNEQWVFDDIVMTGDSATTTSWTGSWDNGVPINSTKAVIDGDYDMTTNPLIETCECEVKTGSTLTITSGKYMKIQNNLINNGTIIIEDGGSLTQVSSSGNVSGSGTYTVKRNTTPLPSEHVFTYWSSPLSNSTLAEVVPNADNYYTFNATTQSWTAAGSGTAMIPGVGYITKGPTDGVYPTAYTANYTGSTFNNGDIVVAMSFSADADADNDWNLVGNPYPSAINADALIAANATMGGTIYFWTHNTDASFTQDFTQDDYVSWNGSGGTAGCTGCVAPNGFIASGQGFFVQALSASNLTFTNAIRETGSNTNFYRATNEKDRIWLNFSGENTFSQILIAFLNEATDGVDRLYDGIRLDGGAAANFYSIIDNQPYGIQGKSSLTESETIPIGFKVTKSGTFTISIDHLEGVIENSTILLIDKLLNVQHNLKDSSYTFSLDSPGEFDTRFDLQIQTSTEILDVQNEDIVSSKLMILVSNQKLIIKTTDNKFIDKVIVYNILGQQIANSTQPSNSILLKSASFKRGNIFIVKSILASGKILYKKVFINK